MKILAIIKWVSALLGLAMLVGAGLVLANTRSFLAHASRTQGLVIGLTPNYSNNSVSYAPVVSFTHGTTHVEFISGSSSNPPAYSIGQSVPVLYLDSNPYKARLDTFFSLWGGVVILGGLGGAFMLVSGVLVVAPLVLARNADRLMREGIAVQAKVQGIEMNLSIEAGSRHPFQITAQWQDPATARVYVFVSRNLWYDPSPYLTQQEVRVYIQRDNPRKYYMDLSFLPQVGN